MEQHNLSIFSPASPPAESIRTLSVLVFAITGVIFLVVEGVLIYLIVRFRRRAVDDTKEPPQVYGSKPIEIAWTAAPALIVFILDPGHRPAPLWEVQRRAAEPPRGRTAAVRHGGRPPVVVGISLRPLRRPGRSGFIDRQRAARPGERGRPPARSI